jgi:hypothetical protein
MKLARVVDKTRGMVTPIYKEIQEDDILCFDHFS